MKLVLWLAMAALPLLGQKEVVNLSPGTGPDEHPQLLELLKVKRLYVERLAGGDTAVQIRDMLIGALQATRLFVVTENAEKADTILRGSAEDLVFTDTFQSSAGLHGPPPPPDHKGMTRWMHGSGPICGSGQGPIAKS